MFVFQSSQLAQFFTYKTELQNKQYHFKPPQVESYDVWESVAVIHFTIVMIKNHVKFLSYTHVSNKMVIKSSLGSASIKDGVSYVHN